MNKYFRVIWNKARHAWVVACEFALGGGKSGCSKRVVGATLALSVALLSNPTAALTAALEDEEEKSLIWVMQMHNPDASRGVGHVALWSPVKLCNVQ